jgi:hypothetical protein
MVEIELDRGAGARKVLRAAAVLIAALAVAGLAFAGRLATPVDGEGRARILTWSDWQEMKAQRAFRAERDRMRRDAEELARLLEARPDPVRAMLLRDRIRRETAGGHPALEASRQALREAAEAVAAWASGGADIEEARQAVQKAVERLR